MGIDLNEAVHVVANGDNILFIIGGLIAVVAIIFGSVGKVLRSNASERTRREIAAYIAEGSMTPEQGERLLKAGKPKHGCS